MIKELRLKNFKCFQSLQIKLAPLTLLAGLNGMGKSSVIQSLLLLRQSWKSGDLQEDRLILNGDLANLGTGEDILMDGADDDFIEIGFTSQYKNKNTVSMHFRYKYDKTSDSLKGISSLEDLRKKSDVFNQIQNGKIPPFGNRFHYIFAERWGPRKLLPLSESKVKEKDLGSRGEYVLHFLHEYGKSIKLEERDARMSPLQGKKTTLEDQVDAWLQEISPGSHLKIDLMRRADSLISGFEFERPGDVKTRAFRATNVGFGLSYALPVIVALLATPPGGIVILENPEAHMHPQGQTKLGQLAARAAAAGVQVILETHSDHVMNGVRIEVRQGRLTPEQTAFHYFERLGVVAQVQSPRIDRDGRLDEWPSGFFDQHDENLAALLAPPAKIGA